VAIIGKMETLLAYTLQARGRMNGFTLNEEDLLKKFRKSKDLEIERLLTQYGTSLADVREMYPQLTQAVAQRRLITTFPTQPLFFTAAEAAQMGLGLQEGAMLKLSPIEGNGGLTSSIITPQKWEITEDNYYISPSGDRLSEADMRAMLSEPTGGLVPDELFYQTELTIENLTEAGREQYQEYQTSGGELGVADWVDLRERQRLETEEVFGAVFPQQDIAEVLAYAQSQPEAFLQDIFEIGRTEEIEMLLRTMYEGVTEEWLTELFTPTIGSPELRQNLIDALKPVTETNIDTMVQYFGDNPQALRASLIGEGRNEATERLVRQLWPDITEQQLSDYFNPSALIVEAEAAREVERGKWGTFTAGVGDLVANVGGIFKWCGAEGIGEKITTFAKYMQVQAAPIPFEPDEFTWKQLFNPQFYATYGVRMLPTLMLLAVPALGAYSLAGSIAARVGLGAVGRAVITGVGGAALSRPIESALEAGGAYDEARARGLSHEEAEQVADEVFRRNLTLAGLDALQLAVAFMPTPVGKAAAGAVTRGLVTTAKIGGKLFFTGLTEGGEEVYQEMILKQAMGDERGLAEMLQDPDMQLVFSLGAIAGLGMGAGGDIIVRIQNRVIPQLNSEQKAQFDKSKEDFVSQGLSEDVATQKALDNVVEQNPELEKVVEDAAKGVEKEITFEQIKPKTEAEAVVVEHMKQQIVPEEVTPEAITPEVTIPKAEAGMPEVEMPVEPIEVKTGRQLEGLGRMYQEWWSKRKTADETKAALAKFVKENLPMEARGKFISAVARVKTDTKLTVLMTRVMEFAENNAQKVLKTEIRAELKKARAQIKDHILKGKFTPETQRLFDVLNHNLELDRDTAREKIVTNIRAYESGELSYEEMFKANEALNFAGIDGMSSEELANLLNYIRTLEAIGRSERQAKQEIANEKIKAVSADISNILTGGKGLKTGIGAVPGKGLEAKPGWVDTFVNWQYGIDNLADKLSKFDTTSGPYQSEISKFVSQVHRATNRQFIGTKEAYAKVKDVVGEVFGVKGGRAINQVLNGLDEEVNLGTFELTADYIANHPGATTVTIKMTRNEMLAKYMQMQDPTLNNTFTTGMGWSMEFRNSIENNLTAEEKKLTDSFFKFYEDYYKTINPIYQELYNVDMPHNPRYSPIRRDFEADITESILTFQDAAQYASVLNGSLKARQRNIRPLKFNGATQILSNHIEQMEHFKAWATTMRDMRRVFGNTEIKQAIEQYHGRGIVQLIDKFMNQMARGGIETATTNRIADWLRRNFTRSILAIKPVIALKQIPSLFAYVSDQEMGVTGFVSGIANFWTSPIDHFKFLYKNSEGFRARIQAGFERDIAAALAQHGNKEIAGRGSIKNWFMLQIRLGDTFAVTQGMWAKYRDGLNKGLSQTEAIVAAEDLTNRTQPSFGIDTLSAIQNGGSWLKLMTMFQNQPNKYFRMVGDNLRNFKYGRGSRTKAAGTILLAWVLLPMMFQFIADAFQWKPERQARAGILGPLNFILIGGQLVQSIWGWLTNEPFDYQVSPVAQTADDLRNIFLKAKKLIGQGQDPYKDISLDDVAALVEYLAKAAGQITGWPTPYLVQVEKGIRTKLQEGEDINIKDFLFSQWALQPPAKNAEQKVEDLNLKLGEVKEGQEDKPLSERELNLYTTIDWFRDIGNVYSNVLPQDVLDNPAASKESKAWAEYEIAQSKADILPNIALYKINTEDNDDTIVNYYQQWKARERITNLAQLKEFDTLYPKAYLGNVSRQQYEVLVKYLESDDKDAFLDSHSELRINPRDEWLKANPMDNARLALALGEKAKLLTLEAYNQFKGLLKTLDIPADAIPPMTLPPEGSLETHFAYENFVSEGKHGSWEAQLLLLKDDIAAKEAGVQSYAEWRGLKLSDTPLALLELQVANREQFDLYEAYGDDTPDNDDYISDDDDRATARHGLLFDENEDMTTFGKAYYTKEAYSQGYSESNWPAFVEYSAQPLWGSWRERYLLENPDFYKEYTDSEIGNHPLIDKSTVKPLARDKIYQQFLDEFDKWDDTGGMAPKAIENMRAGLEDIERGGMTFKEARYRVQAYDVGVPEKYIDLYVEYYELPTAGYEQEWFFMDHVDYYRDVWLGVQGNQSKDFSKVPTKEVWNLYKEYLKEDKGQHRLDFRAKYPELDQWMLLTGKVSKLVGDRGNPEAEHELTPWEELAQVEGFKELFK